MSSQLEDAFNEAVERRTAELRAALEFYANADNYVGGEVGWWADAPGGGRMLQVVSSGGAWTSGPSLARRLAPIGRRSSPRSRSGRWRAARATRRASPLLPLTNGYEKRRSSKPLRGRCSPTTRDRCLRPGWTAPAARLTPRCLLLLTERSRTTRRRSRERHRDDPPRRLLLGG